MKNKILIFGLVLIILLPAVVQAQTDNKTGFEKICSKGVGLAVCVQQIYLFSLGFGAILALLMLVLAGYKYMTAEGNATQVESAKESFADAFIGLVIIFVAFILLNVINPDLVRFRDPSQTLSLPAIQTGLGESAKPPEPPLVKRTDTPAATSDAELANKIKAAAPSIELSRSSAQGWEGYYAERTINEISLGLLPSVCSVDHWCKPGGDSGTTTVNPKILQGLLDLNKTGGYAFTINSLTTGKHSRNNDAHYLGNAVDLTPKSQNPAYWIEVRAFLNRVGGAAICENSSTGQDVPNCEPIPEPVSHIHWILIGR